MTNALKILAVLSFACGSAAAGPDAAKPAPTTSTTPATKPAPGAKPAAKCKAAGGVLFEIDHLVEPGAKLATSTTKVYGNGTWTKDDVDAEGKAHPQTVACLAKPDLDKLKTNLSGAEWKVSTAQVHCMAMSQSYVVYKVNGKTVFTRKLCNGQALDEKSQAKLQAAIEQVEDMVPAQVDE